jgi:outer membrane protein assembly factor BamA
MKQSDQDGWMAGGALAALNFLGQDIRMEVQARFTVEPWMQAKEYAFYASSPYWGDLPLDWKMDYVDVDSWDPLRNYAEKSHNAQVEVKYPWRYPWQIAALGGYRGIEHKNQDQLDWLDASIDQALFAGIGAIWDTRDSRTSTQKGLYSEWLLVKNGIANLRSSSHWEMLWDFETNHRLGRNDVIKTGWLFRYRVGSVGFYDRYQQGGANTLRGYFPDSSAHGNSELLYNAEIRKRIVQRKSISLFDIHGYYALDAVLGSDIGLLWDDKLPKAESARSGIYAGIHIVVPAIERVRIEAGINPQNGAWAVTVGLFEKRITQRWRSR